MLSEDFVGTALVIGGSTVTTINIRTTESQTIVSPGLAQHMGVEGSPAGSIGGAGGAVQSSVGTLKSLSFGVAQLENVTVVVSDIFSPLNQAVGVSMDGILGYNFLRKFKITIDYPNEVLRFQKQ